MTYKPYTSLGAPAQPSSGGLVVARVLSLGARLLVKGSAGQIFGWFLYNAGTETVYVKLYDIAIVPTSANTPKLTLAIPPGSAANMMSGLGIQFNNGIAWGATKGLADNDDTLPASGQVTANLFYV